MSRYIPSFYSLSGWRASLLLLAVFAAFIDLPVENAFCQDNVPTAIQNSIGGNSTSNSSVNPPLSLPAGFLSNLSVNLPSLQSNPQASPQASPPKEAQGGGNEIISEDPASFLKENLYKSITKKPQPSVRPQTGIISIKQKGENYDIDLQLDMMGFKDENYVFKMDLPYDGKKTRRTQAPAQIDRTEDWSRRTEPSPEDKKTDDEKYEDQRSEDKKYEPPVRENIATTPARKKEKQPVQDTSVSYDDDVEKPDMPTVDSVNESSKHLLYAQTYFMEGKLERALSEVNRAIEANPNSAIAIALKGSVFFRMGELDLAKAFWKQAMKIDPTLEHLRDSLQMIEGTNP